jgi:hypothetical protein
MQRMTSTLNTYEYWLVLSGLVSCDVTIAAVSYDWYVRLCTECMVFL